jgi:hypothetical protein
VGQPAPDNVQILLTEFVTSLKNVSSPLSAKIKKCHKQKKNKKLLTQFFPENKASLWTSGTAILQFPAMTHSVIITLFMINE